MSSNMLLDQPGAYRIRVQGALDKHWAEYFDAMEIVYETLADGNQATILTGTLPDQAAVQGTLQKLYNLGFPLLSVEKIEASG